MVRDGRSRRADALTPRRVLGAARTAALIALLLILTVGPARASAANPLGVSADASYVVDPAAGRVHVAIAYRVTDHKPNSAQFIYYYTGFRLSIQGEARSVKASDAGGALDVATKSQGSYFTATVDFRSFLYYGQTARFTVRYDLVGGAPRSDSSVRVGKAFATFGVWAWGDPGKGSVTVSMPAGFGSNVDGDPMSTTSSGGKETLRARPAEPERFFSIVTAESPLSYTSDRLSLDGGIQIVIKAWPEDHRWDDIVGSTLRTALPELRRLIGLDWPVSHDLNVRERYTPALEGYAGVFFTDEQRIDVSEDLDPVVIVHEASHAWLNQDLFLDRWIYEGLAQEYAWRAQQAVGGESGSTPDKPDPKDPGHVLLSSWTFPEVIRDQKTDDQERYGYQASFWVIHNIVDAVGVDVMRDAFAAAHGKTTAYPGAGPAETVSGTSGWKRLLDLVEPIDRTDQPDVEAALRSLVLDSSAAKDLDDRADARTAYRALLTAGAGWQPGWYLRKPMGEWRFAVAEARIDEATAVLGLRHQVDAAAAALGLQPGDALRTAYESADESFDGATKVAQDELAALGAIAAAKSDVEATPDLFSTVGLLGETPGVPYDAARAAFASGDLAGATSSAASASELIHGAAAAGQQRVLLVAAVIGAMVVLLALALVLRRRRRHARALALATASTATAVPASEPAAPEASGTLAPVSGGAPPLAERPPEPEGGPP